MASVTLTTGRTPTREAMYPKIGDETSCARGNAETMRPVKALHDLRACGASFCFSGRACFFALACDLDQPCNEGLSPRMLLLVLLCSRRERIALIVCILGMEGTRDTDP